MGNGDRIGALQDILLHYANGFFPMADYEDQDTVRWWSPDPRAVLPIQGLHVPRNLQRLILKSPYEIRVDTAFAEVIRACAENRSFTWLNDTIREAFIALHHSGFAHSVECWTHDGRLAGGLYGLALGSAFCGESMFSRESNASKVALVHLCARLSAGGFTLLDAQILNDHTSQFGAHEISRDAYLGRLGTALRQTADFALAAQPPVNPEVLVRNFLSVEKLKKDLTIS